MKKTIVALIALALLFGSVASVTLAKENEQERERISSPSEMKNFKDVIKKGKDLFGIRQRVLEKINSLEELANFDSVKKIGNTLWGFRKQSNEAPVISPVAVTCVKNAIDKKDTALKAGIPTLSTKMTELIDARNTCQKAALDKTTAKEQMTANKVCLDTFKKAVENGKKAVKNAQKNIWETYKQDLKTCNQLQKAEVGSGEIQLEDGGLGIDL